MECLVNAKDINQLLRIPVSDPWSPSLAEKIAGVVISAIELASHPAMYL